MPEIDIQGSPVETSDDGSRLIYLKSGQQLRFPATMSDDAIRDAIKTKLNVTPAGTQAANVITEAGKGVPLLGHLAEPGMAAIGALFSAIPKANEEDTSSYTDRLVPTYNKALEDRKAATKKFEEQSPVAATATNIAGGAGGLGLLGRIPKVGEAINWGLGATGNFSTAPIRSAVSSGIIGGADSAIKGEGDPAVSAAMGAALGAPIPLLSTVAGNWGGKAVGAGADALRRMTGRGGANMPPILDKLDPEALKWASWAAKSDKLPEAEIAQRTSELGKRVMPLDVGDNMAGLAEAAGTMLGGGKGIIRNALEGRVKELPKDITEVLDRNIGPTINIEKTLREMQADRAKTSAPLYKAFHDLRVQPTPELQSILEIAEKRGLLKEAQELAELSGAPLQEKFFVGGPRKEYPTAATWDQIKQSIDSRIEGSYNTIGQPTKVTHAYTDFKNRLVNAIDNHPDQNVRGVWKAAREAWADPSEVMKAMREGRNWRNVEPDEIPYLMQGLSSRAQAAYKDGMRRDIADLMRDTLAFNPMKDGSARGSASTVNTFMKNQERLEGFLGKKEADEIVREAQRHDVFANKRQSIVQGAATAGRQQAQGMLTPNPEDLLTVRLPHMYSPHVTPAAYMIPKSVRDAARQNQVEQFEAQREKVARLLVEGNPQGGPTTPQHVEDFVKALQQYQAPVDVATPMTNYYSNLLMHTGLPHLSPVAQKPLKPFLPGPRQ